MRKPRPTAEDHIVALKDPRIANALAMSLPGSRVLYSRSSVHVFIPRVYAWDFIHAAYDSAREQQL